MDNNCEPSFEVVDKAEDAEQYLLAKNCRTSEQQQTTQHVDPPLNNISTNSDTTSKEEDKMNFNGINFFAGSSTSEVKDVDTVDVDADDCNVRKCVTEDEEGQEALWLEEADSSPSASSMNASPAVKKPSTRRTSFLFGSVGGANNKAATISPKRSISFRKKKNPPKVMLLDGLTDFKNNTPALVPTVSSDDVAVAAAVPQPDAVVASETISSLGFDKSFDVKSPLSMSSLNEILDAPPTPMVATVQSATANEPNKKRTKTNVVRGMFQKKDKTVKAKNSFSFLSFSRYARSVTIVEKEDNKDDDDDDDADPVLRASRNINERIQASLMRAMENDDAESLTSFTGVPMIMKEENTTKPNEKNKSLTMLQGQKPLNFEKVKPTFVVSKDGLSMAEIQEKFVPMYDEEDEENIEDEQQNLASPNSASGGEEVEALKSSSPNSTGADSAVTDRYEVAQNIDGDCESEDDDGKSDKYSVLPDPCSFCDSFWVATDNEQAVSRTLSESPDTKSVQNKCDVENALDSPVIDKYAELPEVAATTEHGENTEPESSVNRSTTVVTSNRTLSGFLGKFKRPTSTLEMTETSGSVEPLSMEPEENVAPESSNNEPKLNTEDTEPIVAATKSTTSSFFGAFQKSAASKSKARNVAPDVTTVAVVSSMNAPALDVVAPLKVVPRKSILKKRKEVQMIPVDEPTSYIVPGNDLESPGAKISVLSLGSDDYVVPAATTSATVTSKTTATVSLQQHPIEDPSTEGSSSADDEVANSKILSIAPLSPSKSSNADPLLTRLRKNLHKRRGLEPQTDVDPIITVGNGRTRLDP